MGVGDRSGQVGAGEFEMFFAEMDETFEIDVAYHADDHTVGGVVGCHEGFEHLGCETADIFLVA